MSAKGPVVLVRKETTPDDIHGMDVSKGILTAVGGLTSHEAQRLVRGLAGLSLVGGDIVEVSPLYDGPGQITSVLASNLMFEFLCAIACSASVTDGV